MTFALPLHNKTLKKMLNEKKEEKNYYSFQHLLPVFALGLQYITKYKK